MDSFCRNKCLDMLKGIGCIFVIFIHIPFPQDTTVGKLILLLAKFAVPMFFMISGYYAYGKNIKVILNRAKKIFIILLCSLALYFVYVIIKSRGNYEYTFSITKLLKILILGDFTFTWTGHLWFLLALIYSYLIYGIIKNLSNFIYILIPILFCLHIVIYILAENNVACYNNFLLTGLPWFLSGNFAAKYKMQIEKKLSNFSISIIVSAGISILGLRRFMSIDISYFGTVLYAIGLLGFAIKNPDFSICSSLCILGQKYSMYVYIFHVLFIHITENFIENRWIAPIIITIITILFSIFFYKIKSSFTMFIYTYNSR